MTDAGPEKPGPGKTARGGAACPRESLPAAGAGTGRSGLAVAGFSSDLSHDFRTPLNIIIGFSELLLEEIPGKLNEEQRLDLTDILNSGRRLLGLVNAMLERFETGDCETP
jgi:signal transduction histidine kinase